MCLNACALAQAAAAPASAKPASSFNFGPMEGLSPPTPPVAPLSSLPIHPYPPCPVSSSHRRVGDSTYRFLNAHLSRAVCDTWHAGGPAGGPNRADRRAAKKVLPPNTATPPAHSATPLPVLTQPCAQHPPSSATPSPAAYACHPALHPFHTAPMHTIRLHPACTARSQPYIAHARTCTGRAAPVALHPMLCTLLTAPHAPLALLHTRDAPAHRRKRPSPKAGAGGSDDNRDGKRQTPRQGIFQIGSYFKMRIVCPQPSKP